MTVTLSQSSWLPFVSLNWMVSAPLVEPLPPLAASSVFAQWRATAVPAVLGAGEPSRRKLAPVHEGLLVVMYADTPETCSFWVVELFVTVTVNGWDESPGYMALIRAGGVRQVATAGARAGSASTSAARGPVRQSDTSTA